LGETRPELIPTMVERLRVDLAHISDRYDSAPRSSADLNRPSTEPRLKSKTDDTLRRERIILEAVLKTDQPLASNVLHKLVTDAESGVKVATLTANLDRMTKAGALVRPRKGYYSSDSLSRSYLQSLESEIEARGIGQSLSS
ncbi:MAG: hypothetical protein ACR2OX_02160, partial [Methyloligellaceae bacterium]